MPSIELRFKNINIVNNKQPSVRVVINDVELLNEPVKTKMVTPLTLNDQPVPTKNILKIFFDNKEDSDTKLDHENKIVADLNFELEQIIIDGHDIKNLIWNSEYVAKGEKIPSCLFFGPKGHFEFQFDMPILKWILKSNHEKHNNDPNWEEDYNYYTEAWELLSQI